MDYEDVGNPGRRSKRERESGDSRKKRGSIRTERKTERNML